MSRSAAPSAPEGVGGAALSSSHRLRRRLRTLAVGLALVLGVLVLRATVAVPVRIASDSMAPTYAAGNVVLVSQSAPDVADLRDGNVVVFTDPVQGRRTIKRVVGLPGEEVVILDSVLYVDGEPVEEPWVDHALIDGYYSRTFHVPADHVFVMGDNRGNSVDSRDYGPVPAADLQGRVLLRLWPWQPAEGPQPRPRP